MTENTDRLRVLQIASGDLWAGAEMQLYTLARQLDRNPAIELVVALLNHGELERRLASAGIDVIVIDESRTGTPGILARLIDIIRDRNIDVIHTHRQKENILGSLAGLFGGRVPSLRTVHGAPEHKPPLRKLHKHAIARADLFCARHLQGYIVAVSTDLAQRLADRFPAAKTRVIENGIDLEELARLRQSRAAGNGSRRDTARIGIAGRLVAVKRVDLFLRAARHLLDHHPELQADFHIYGDGPLRSDLGHLSSELGLSERVHFEGHRDDMHAQLVQLDALLMTSDHEGTPMVLLEALALGVPVIAHACGGIPEVLDHGRCGVLVEDHSPGGYAAALANQLAGTGQSAAPRTAAIRDHLENRYSASRNARLYTDLYMELALPASKRRGSR